MSEQANSPTPFREGFTFEYLDAIWHLINGHVYTYSDVLVFVEQSRKTIQLVRDKVEGIHSESCKVSEEFFEHTVACGTGILILDKQS
ncbi:hypothetical protein H6F44_08935 [Pseudanabaena sp. FACHB-1277]|uniref:Uncharacterized protein n=1 Tax=Pseudanabaena cinerea FACHB-1277 TaxID=2949581 RepID=A0A926US63_9CYAN|nr:hypothetical protein [Pseudanabaena cinerea]MBD2150240.1 hypothetical protein [Pseudanabaena cinerea FACHB-1277]